MNEFVQRLAISALAVLALVAVLFPVSLHAQDSEQLYAALVRSRGYVVGGPLAGSGLHYLEGDTTWTHVGWNHPIVFGIAVDQDDPDIIFLAGGNGALRTLDGGESWRVTTGWRVTEVMDVDIDPRDGRNVYIATSYGIWRSSDRGETWEQSDRGVAEKYTSAIRVDRTDSRTLLAGTVGGIYRSGDRGGSWSRVSDSEYVTDLQQSRSQPSTWLASSHDGGVFVSHDGGDSWTVPDGDVDDASLYAAAIDPSDPSRMAAVGFERGLYVSDDGGSSWRRSVGDLPGCVALTVVTDPPDNPGPCLYEVVFSPDSRGSLIVATVESGLFRSDDLGRSWTYVGMNGSVVYDLLYAGANR